MALSEKQIEEAIRKNRGLVTVAARSLGVSRKTVHVRVAQSETLKEALAEAREFTADVAESKLFDCIESGEGWAIKYFLSTQAKARGYVEKGELDITSGGNPWPTALTIRHEIIDAASDAEEGPS
jgi:hypothetical protein